MHPAAEIYNRRGLEKRISALMEDTKLPAGSVLAMIDADGLKEVARLQPKENRSGTLTSSVITAGFPSCMVSSMVRQCSFQGTDAGAGGCCVGYRGKRKRLLCDGAV